MTTKGNEQASETTDEKRMAVVWGWLRVRNTGELADKERKVRGAGGLLDARNRYG